MKRIFQRRSWWFCFDSDIVKIRFQIFLKRREFSNRIALWSKIFSSVRGICESNKGGDLFRGVRKSNETFQRINRGRRRFELFPRTRLIALRDTARYLFGVSWWPPRYLSSRADLRVGVMCFVESRNEGTIESMTSFRNLICDRRSHPAPNRCTRTVAFYERGYS